MSQFFKLKRLSLNQVTQRIEEQLVAFLVAALEAKSDLIQVRRQMLFAQMMIRTNDRPLDEAPHRFDSVRSAISIDPLLFSMIDLIVQRFTEIDSLVVGMRIGVNAVHIRPHHVIQEFLNPRVGYSLFDAKAHSATALESAHDARLITDKRRSAPARFPAVPCLVVFDCSFQRSRIHFFHRVANAMAQIPRRLVTADSQRAHHLVRGHSFFCLRHQVDGEKPRIQRQVRIMENRLRRNAELIAAFRALEFFLRFQPTDCGMLAA